MLSVVVSKDVGGITSSFSSTVTIPDEEDPVVARVSKVTLAMMPIDAIIKRNTAKTLFLFFFLTVFSMI